MSKKITYYLARNCIEFHQFIRGHRVDLKYHVYIDSPEKLLGVENPSVCRLDGYVFNQEIEDAIAIRTTIVSEK